MCKTSDQLLNVPSQPITRPSQCQKSRNIPSESSQNRNLQNICNPSPAEKTEPTFCKQIVICCYCYCRLLLLPMMISVEVKCAVIVHNKLLYIYHSAVIFTIIVKKALLFPIIFIVASVVVTTIMIVEKLFFCHSQSLSSSLLPS